MPNSPAGSTVFSEEALDGSHHFKWTSIRNLVYLAHTYSSHPTFFYLFNHLAKHPVTMFNFTAVALVIGMTYMCVELFIKQYTRRFDWNQNLSPMLKGITVASILQNTLICLLFVQISAVLVATYWEEPGVEKEISPSKNYIFLLKMHFYSQHVRYAGDGARYLASSLGSTPIWSACSNSSNVSRCLDSKYVLKHCENKTPTERLPFNLTSVHLHYKASLTNSGSTLTWRFFVAAVIWILNFCLTTIPDSVLLKFYKHVVYVKAVSTMLMATFLALSSDRSQEAFLILMNINANHSIIRTLIIVALIYCVGMVGLYDFGMTSPFLMIDNVVLIFSVCYIFLCTISSFIVNILVLEVTNCVEINHDDASHSWHYILFAVLPLATEFLYGQKVINMFLYLHLLLAVLPFLMLNTTTLTRLLHSEFPSIRIIYVEGLFCLLGFCLSMPILLVDKYVDNVRLGLNHGLSISILYLGGLRMAIIMWVYGVEKLSTDINFWLGFSPTTFWTFCWTILPALLLVSFGYTMYGLFQYNTVVETIALIWFLISALIVFGLQTNTVVRYVMQNNLMGAFRCSKKYGPPDPRDRRRRRRYDVTIDHRECFHDCMPVDEEVDCNHLPLMNTGEGPPSNESESSLTQMYENLPFGSTSLISVVESIPDTKDKHA